MSLYDAPDFKKGGPPIMPQKKSGSDLNDLLSRAKAARHLPEPFGSELANIYMEIAEFRKELDEFIKQTEQAG